MFDLTTSNFSLTDNDVSSSPQKILDPRHFGLIVGKNSLENKENIVWLEN